MNVSILGVGRYLPQKVVSAESLDKKLSLKPGTVFKHQRIATRRFALDEHEETSSRMAALATKAALKHANLNSNDLDTIIAVSVLPERPMPTNSALINKHLELGQSDVTCFDINASCLGFIQGLQVASALIETGQARNVALVASEVASKGLNWEDVGTCTLIGDGAAAAILGPTPTNHSSKLLGCKLQAFSEGIEYCKISAGGSKWNIVTPPKDNRDYLFHMDGRKVLKLAMKVLPTFLSDFLEDLCVSIEDIDIIIPHQASAIGLASFLKNLNLPSEKMVSIVEVYGNQVSVSLPHALFVGITSERLVRGQTALLVGTGAGLSCGAALLRY